MTAVSGNSIVKLTKNVASAALGGLGTAVLTGNNAVLTPKAGQALFTSSTGGLSGNGSVGAQFNGGYMLVLMEENAANANAVVTPKAGVTGQTPANLAVQGDGAAITFGSGEKKVIQLDLARFQQADGTVILAVSGASANVKFTVLQLDPSA